MVSLIVFAVLLIFTTALTLIEAQDARHERLHQQETAEETFLDQPARHPHRMVHYGHYVFRAPPPLALFDPGVDSVTGQSMFLEGHRQNSVMFADARAEARTGGFGSLSPAKLYHFFLPLLIIALGHAVILRERESRTLGPILSQGITGPQLFLGKLTAMLWLVGLLSLPALFSAIVASFYSESLFVALTLYTAHLTYLSIWAALTVLVSLITRSRGLALGVLLAVWVVTVLVVPRIGVTSASAAISSEGKIITDMRMNDDLRKLGDGHNASDPAFDKLKADTLTKYNVETVDQLPVNYRGIVASNSEAKLTNTLNEYAEKRMQREAAQGAHLSNFSWLSPYLAISGASRNLAGTDLATHHRFLREAEALRFEFVQGLNKAHIEVLDYQDDIRRNESDEAFDRTRIDPENWKVLEAFRFNPDPAKARVERATPKLSALTLWLLGLLIFGFISARRLTP